VIEIRSEDSVAEAVASFTGDLARRAGLPPSKAYWLRLATEEIATNVMEHGYRGCGPVRLSGGIQADQVWVRIEDEAHAFDPRAHDARPLLETVPQEREAGGYGLLLALHKLDAFDYERAGGRNLNTLIMFRDLADDPPGRWPHAERADRR
jgi:serine/threonine-protein kinase RsbW